MKVGQDADPEYIGPPINILAVTKQAVYWLRRMTVMMSVHKRQRRCRDPRTLSGREINEAASVLERVDERWPTEGVSDIKR